MTIPAGISAVEESYMLLAEAITEIGPEREVAFLARLALLLSIRLGDNAALREAIAAAKAEV
jgi:hypothetical protein